jgi:hypothetical protein
MNVVRKQRLVWEALNLSIFQVGEVCKHLILATILTLGLLRLVKRLRLKEGTGAEGHLEGCRPVGLG